MEAGSNINASSTKSFEFDGPPKRFFVKGVSPLMLASRTGAIYVVRFLLATPGIRPKAEDENRNHALHMAASQGHADVVRLLIQAGCDIDAQNANKCTSLHMAVRCFDGLEAVRTLVQAGYDHTIGDVIGRTALFLAVQDDSVEILEFLYPYEISMWKHETKGAKHRCIKRAKIVRQPR
jgi:ankyrin repeat protein